MPALISTLMQLDMFSAATPQAVDLRSSVLPTVSEAAAQVGTVEQWASLTLSQVLELWQQLYLDFVAALDEPIHHAKSFCKEKGDNYGQGGPLARQFYQREYERLVKGQLQLRATVEQVFCDNLTAAFEQGKAVLRASGLSEEETEYCEEFFNEVIQRPQPSDLPKLLPVLMQDLAQEYLRLQR